MVMTYPNHTHLASRESLQKCVTDIGHRTSDVRRPGSSIKQHTVSPCLLKRRVCHRAGIMILGLFRTNTRLNKYKVEDLFLRKAVKKHKLTIPWEGPFVVDKVLGDCLYIIAGKQKTFAIHHDRLKPYDSSVIPHWIRRRRANQE